MSGSCAQPVWTANDMGLAWNAPLELRASVGRHRSDGHIEAGTS